MDNAREGRRQRKGGKIEIQGEKENKGDNKEQDTLPYSSSLSLVRSVFIYFFYSSSFEFHTDVFILTGTIMEPERLLREKGEKKEEGND